MTHALSARRHAQPAPEAVLRFIRQAMMRLSLAALAFAFVNAGGADSVLGALANSFAAQAAPHQQATLTSAAQVQARAPAIVWTIDTNSDGIADFSNPTHTGVRGVDAFGSGVFGARRDAGKRRHHGVDYVAAAGASVRAPISGEVTRIGFAYRGVGGFRVIEIVNPDTKYAARVLYVAPTVAVGDAVVAGEAIGAAQDLSARYPGITNHVHIELRDANRRLIDASEQLPSATQQAQRITPRNAT